MKTWCHDVLSLWIQRNFKIKYKKKENIWHKHHIFKCTPRRRVACRKSCVCSWQELGNGKAEPGHCISDQERFAVQFYSLPWKPLLILGLGFCVCVCICVYICVSWRGFVGFLFAVCSINLFNFQKSYLIWMGKCIIIDHNKGKGFKMFSWQAHWRPI